MRLWIMLLLYMGGLFGMNRSQYFQKIDEASNRTCKILNKKYNLTLIGTGGGVKDDMMFVCLRLTTSDKHTLEQARKIIIDSVDILVLEINKNEILKDYKEYKFPFTEKNIDIIINLADPLENKTPRKQGDLCAAYCNEGRLFYDIYVSKYKYETLLRETYEEAKGKL